jgi:hypothetical protein
MRTLRVFVVGALVAGGLAVLAPGAVASVPAASKTCKQLNALNQKLQQAFASANTGTVDTAAISNMSSSFRSAEKSAPKSLKSAMTTISTVAANVAHTSSTAEAAAALKNGGAKLASALATWGTYLAANCSGTSVSTT